jgi:hypothetical protein
MIETAIRKLSQYKSQGHEDKTSSVLRALLDHAPSEQGRETVASDIVGCQTDEKLRQLSQYYIANLLVPSQLIRFSHMYMLC